VDLPSLTIITPCLNAAATLPATLASVRAQEYPGLEHIVVDGGSTDGTLDVLAAAEGVRWISEPDRGLSHALNKGFAHVHGDIWSWLNSDDLLEPGVLRRVAEGADVIDDREVSAAARRLDDPATAKLVEVRLHDEAVLGQGKKSGYC